MGLKKGVKKNSKSGRRKGTPNKRTLDLQERLIELNLSPLDGLSKVIPDLDPNSKAHVYLSMLPYLYPKRKAIEISYEDEEKLLQINSLENMSEFELKRIIQKAVSQGKHEIEV